ncbi:hypothetical protein ASA1KI_37790 [Opitutales bacterium ASA1]|nr:hypothetical protein ASA1KI_37790 [Opitutales bacterium ASA1]
MEGYPGIPDEERSFADPRFRVLAAVDFPEMQRAKGRWYTATLPLCRPDSGLSPADYFGRTMIEHLPADHRVGVVSVAVAGARIEVYDPTRVGAYEAAAPDWLKRMIAAYDGDPYARLIELAREAQKVGVIRGVLLHQGESNTGDATWPAQVKELYERLLADLALTAVEVPLLVGGLVAEDQGGKCASMNTVIAALPRTIPTAHFVSSDGCEALEDQLHFSPAGYRKLGTRYAQAMSALLDLSATGAPPRPTALP